MIGGMGMGWDGVGCVMRAVSFVWCSVFGNWAKIRTPRVEVVLWAALLCWFLLHAACACASVWVSRWRVQGGTGESLNWWWSRWWWNALLALTAWKKRRGGRHGGGIYGAAIDLRIRGREERGSHDGVRWDVKVDFLEKRYGEDLRVVRLRVSAICGLDSNFVEVLRRYLRAEWTCTLPFRRDE